MRYIYLLFYLFTVVGSVVAQPQTLKKPKGHSLDEMREKLGSLSKKDSVTYQKWLTAYLQKAKSTHSTNHLHNAYKHCVFFTDDPAVMHRFTDSLTQHALNTNMPINLIDAYQIRSTVYYIEKNYQQSLAFELKALQLIDKKKHAYEYHRSLYAIGQTHFYLQQYEEALAYFIKARTFFETAVDYRYHQGFMNSIRYEALTNTYLKNYVHSNELVEKGSAQVHKVATDDQAFEKAYIDYVYALNLYFLNNYQKSIDTFKGALPQIRNNDDYANESTAYYYMGLSYWKLGKEKEAVAYFNKIDAVFNKRNYANLEIKNAYNYLIAYYKQKKEEEKQLYYTNQLLKMTVFLQNEYRFLSTALHKQLDIKHLESEKARLEHSLKTNNRLFTTGVVAGSIILIGFAVALVMNYRKKKEYSKRYHALITLRKNAKTEQKVLKEKVLETKNTALGASVVSDDHIAKGVEAETVEVSPEMVPKTDETALGVSVLSEDRIVPAVEADTVEVPHETIPEKSERSVIAGVSDKAWAEIMYRLELFEKNKDF